MLTVRTFLFKAGFLVLTVIEMVLFASFYFFLPHQRAWIVPRMWTRSMLWLLKHVVGTTYEIEGTEHLPQGPCIVAAKHQSAWETMVLTLHLRDPAFVLKRELMQIPGIGWYLAKMGMIAINRGAPVKALRAIIDGAGKAAAAGRQIVIFPEGTRRPPGAAPDYKSGIFPIYSELDLPVVPVALNSGLYWPSRAFCQYPGIIRCRVLPPIQPGMGKRQFMQQLETTIEAACDELLVAAAGDSDPPAMPLTAVERLKKLGTDWKGQVRQ